MRVCVCEVISKQSGLSLILFTNVEVANMVIENYNQCLVDGIDSGISIPRFVPHSLLFQNTQAGEAEIFCSQSRNGIFIIAQHGKGCFNRVVVGNPSFRWVWRETLLCNLISKALQTLHRMKAVPLGCFSEHINFSLCQNKLL